MKRMLQAVPFLLFPLITICQAGKLDRSFGKDGKVFTKLENNGMATLHALALQANNKIIAAGIAENQIVLVRYNVDGSTDNAFGNKGIVFTPLNAATANAVAVQADGKILTAGYIKNGALSSTVVIRYNINGSIDTQFGNNGIVTGTGLTNEYAYAMAIQPDGKILIAGSTDTIADRHLLIMRLNKDGSADNSFGNKGRISIGFTSSSYSRATTLALQTDGKITVGGITNINSFFGSNGLLVRCKTNGTLDSTFGERGKTELSSYYCESIKDIAIDGNGRILIAGTTLDFEGTSNLFMVGRMLPNGEIDYSYGPYQDGSADLNLEYGKMASIALQTDGKAIATGNYFGSIQMARLTTSGDRDSDFGRDGILNITNDKLYTSSNTDPLFPVLIQVDGKIVTGGTYNGNYFLLTRLSGDETLVQNEKDAISKSLSISIYPNPVAANFIIKGLNKAKPISITITDINGYTLKKQLLPAGYASINVSALKSGHYIAIIEQDGKTSSINFIKQ